MRVCVLNGLDQEDLTMAQETKLEQELERLNQKGDTVDYFKLREKKIADCLGCWDCWLKTPGKCRIKDEQEDILKSFVKTDHLVFVSNVRLGFVTATLKKTMDRLIPNFLPYIRVYQNESHHYPRYQNTPLLHTRLIVDHTVEKDEVDLIEDYFKRVALNFGSELKSFRILDEKGAPDYELADM